MSTDAEEPARTLFRALPTISEPAGAAIAASAREVDALLEAVLERVQGAPMVEEQVGYFTEHVQASDDPTWRFTSKKQLLAALVRESLDLPLPDALLPRCMRVRWRYAKDSFMAVHRSLQAMSVITVMRRLG